MVCDDSVRQQLRSGPETTSFCNSCVCVCADLEVYVLNTEADIQDLTFPHSYDSDSILQISALALQQYSNNGG